jgi:hypothetical protein
MLGALTFGRTKQHGYECDDLKVAVAIATHLALAIDRWQQTEKLHEANKELARLASFPTLNPAAIIESVGTCGVGGATRSNAHLDGARISSRSRLGLLGPVWHCGQR